MTHRDITDGAMASGGLTLPVWISWLEGWLQLAVVVLSIVLLVYTIRVRQIELRTKQARYEEIEDDAGES